MRSAEQSKGIFAIEGKYEENLKNPTTIRPALELLKSVADIRYIHQTCFTKEEFFYYLHQWTLSRYADYPILYLATHGGPFEIDLANKTLTLDEIAEELKGCCSNRVIVISSCSTLDIDKRYLKRFLKNIGALMVVGYTSDVEILLSVASEILLLDAIQYNEYSKRGIDAIQRKIDEVSDRFPELHLRTVTCRE